MRQKIDTLMYVVKKHYSYIVLFTVYLVLSSCGKSDPNSPGIEYMPDMYRSPSHEANLSATFEGDTIQANRIPVAGTISRGHIPYGYENNNAGYERAGLELRNPIKLNDKVLAEGEILYSKFCIQCHGSTGAGDGLVAAKLPGPPPAYTSGALANLTEGKIFHSITYGKGMMGSHASQLSQEERWKLVHYVQKLQGKSSSQQAPAIADSATAAETTTVTASVK